MMWTKLATREDVDLTTISGFDVVFYELLDTFASSRNFFTLFHKKNFTHYVGIDFQKLGQRVYQAYFATPVQIESYHGRGIVLLDEIRTASARVGTEELAESFAVFREQFSEINRIYSITSWVAIEAWQKDLETLVARLIHRSGLEEKHGDIMTSLCKPWRATAIADLQSALAVGSDAQDLIDRYQFLRSWSVIWYRSIDREWLENLRVVPSSTRKQLPLQEVFAMLDPDGTDRAFLELAPYMVFFKDWRDEVRRAHAYYWSPLFDEVAGKLGVKRFDIGYLTLDEIQTALEHKTFPRELVSRRKGKPYVLDLNVDGRIEVFRYEGRYEKIVAETGRASTLAAVAGVVAYGGIVRGRVRIIKSYHDIRRVQEGDVIVANTTHPDYLPAMRKAVAFVTNEGGIISHAAIVARELRKPCIVGTGNATEAFKDGDMVEVDAKRGIVKKI